MEYPYHPASGMFPLMSENQLKDLANDIRDNGLENPIVLYHGAILDGRNRFIACKLAGVEPRYNIRDDIPIPEVYVASENYYRRHLTLSQLATIGVKLKPAIQAEAKKRQREGGATGGKQKAGKVMPNSTQPSVDAAQLKKDHASSCIAAKAVGVGRNTIERAEKVMKTDPAEFARLERGETTVNAAYEKVVNARPEPTKRKTIIQGSAKRKMIDGLSMISSICSGLGEIDMPTLRSVCEEKEARMWAETARQSAKGLRVFATNLEGDRS